MIQSSTIKCKNGIIDFLGLSNGGDRSDHSFGPNLSFHIKI